MNRYRISTEEFAKDYNLGNPVYGNLFVSEYDEYVDILERKTKRLEPFTNASQRCDISHSELIFLLLLEIIRRFSNQCS